MGSAKKRTMLGMWAKVDSPFHGHTKVFVPHKAYTPAQLPPGAYMVRIESYMDDTPVPQGCMAVIVCSVHTPHLCVGMARMLCDEVIQEITQDA